MSKIKLYLFALVIACALVSCNKKSDTFMLWGVTEYYSDFMFCDYEPVKMTRTLCFEVNDEMASLKSMLKQCVEILKPGGRIVVLTYHSLEDRIVKDFFGRVLAPLKQVNNKVIVPSDEEVERNPRSRSAKLRIAEKL